MSDQPAGPDQQRPASDSAAEAAAAEDLSLAVDAQSDLGLNTQTGRDQDTVVVADATLSEVAPLDGTSDTTFASTTEAMWTSPGATTPLPTPTPPPAATPAASTNPYAAPTATTPTAAYPAQAFPAQQPYPTQQPYPSPAAYPYGATAPQPVSPVGSAQQGYGPAGYAQGYSAPPVAAYYTPAPQNTSAIVLTIISALMTLSCYLTLAGIVPLIFGIIALTKQGSDFATSKRMSRYGWIAMAVGGVILVIGAGIFIAAMIASASSDPYSY